MNFTVLFTHLKIILLQYFQFSVLSKNKLYPNRLNGKKMSCEWKENENLYLLNMYLLSFVTFI